MGQGIQQYKIFKNGSTWLKLENGHDYINQFLNVAFEGKTPDQYETTNGRSALSLLETIKSGSIDSPLIQQEIVDIMEGGEDAFNKRKEICGIWTKMVSYG